MKKSDIGQFLKTQLLLGLNVLFFYLLFGHISSIYASLNEREPLESLEDLTAAKAKQIQDTVAETLDDSAISQSLYRYFAFFYINNYTERAVFVSNSKIPLTNPVQPIEDVFYQNMLKFHLNDICYVVNTTDIPETSIVSENLKRTDEINENIFYIGCPISIDGVLVGYIGGLNNKSDGSISVEIGAVRQSASNIENILTEL